MKKIIKMLGITGIFTISAVSIISKTSYVEKKQSEELEISTYVEEIAKVMSQEINTQNEEFIKDAILDLISFNDGTVKFDFDRINKISNFKIQKVLSNKKFESVLQNMFNNNQLLNSSSKLFFTENTHHHATIGLWIEAHWYWFGYVQPHLSHELVNQWTMMMNASDGVNVIGNIIGLIPEFTTVAPTLGPFVILKGKDYFQSLDKGNGMGFGSYAMVGFVPWSFFSD